MERFTMSLEDELASQFDQFIREHGYSNRSEAMRDLIRHRLEAERLERSEQGDCVAALGYVYNHHESELAGRVTSAHHDHHELTMSTTHVHLDHDNCFEIAILRGPIGNVRRFANGMIAQRGIRHGSLQMIPVETEEEAHHPDGASHVHSRPRT